jgi:tripartite-type tricarboxylate transporter receptor subunit TctC
MRLTRRAAFAVAAAFPAAALAFPERPVRLVLGFPAGTGPDLVARLLADGLRDSWPAGVVVENRPGAAGAIAAQEVARATADGHTLLLGEVAQLAMAPSTYARLPYDPARDFAPIAEVAESDFAFIVPASVPVQDFAGFIAWARARPSLFLATFGAGTPGHFGAAILAAEARLPAEPVHFRSTGEAMTALLGGEVHGLFGTVALVTPHVRAGRAKALVTTGRERSRLLAEVPSVLELGQPSLAFTAWFGLVAPAATPPAALTAIEAAVLRALALPAVRGRLEEAGFRVAAAGRADFGALIGAETRRWAEVVRATGFRAIE